MSIHKSQETSGLLSTNKLELKVISLNKSKFEFPVIANRKKVIKILKEKEINIRKQLHGNKNNLTDNKEVLINSIKNNFNDDYFLEE